MPISTPADIESFKVNSSPKFQALIAESRRANPPGTGLTTEQVRRALPPQAAQEWFDPALARFAAQSVRAQLQALRSRSDAVSAPATAGA
jgi:hypothetical protein